MKKKILISNIIILICMILIMLENKAFAIENNDYVYLSDISYVTEKSFAASNHTIHKDQNDSNEIITLKINNQNTSFIKGICAWATSEIVYDLKDYNYDYFTSYLGIDISEQSNYFNTGAKFYIYTSADGENWEEQYQSETIYGWSEAPFVKIDIKNKNYLKLVADDNSSSWWANWYDETVFANAKLIKENYQEDTTTIDFIKKVDEYDQIIKNHFNDQITGDYELTLLQRELVNNVGYDLLQALSKYKEEYKETIYWLMNDKETLRLYLVGGKPEGSYINSIKVLSDLYTTYKADLSNNNVTKYGTRFGNLYRTMMLSLSLTESGNVYFWMDGKTHSNALTRYEIYKNLHLEELIENKTFETLTVEEMRFVMNTVIDDEEIVWLNNFVRNDKKGATSPYSYIKYTFGYDYSLDKYYNTENYNKWNEKYHLSKYNITYQKGQPKLWIVFEEGSVCGGLSKTGSCIWGSYKGLPNTCVSQPGHCAYIYYTQDSNGNGIWNLGNDVSGWGQSGKTEHLNVRTMNDWGTGSYTSGWNANYILLAQAAQNEYEKYEESEKILMLANVYKDDNQKLEKIYRKAIESEKINFDAWLGLVNLYENDTTKTEADYYKLAEEIAKTFTYYPYPMNDLLKLIKPHLTSVEYSTMYTLLQTRTLTTATKATDNESIQVAAVKQVANALLGNIDTTIASFSFDGENAGKIILSSRYDNTDVAWEYSLDGGNTWILTQEHQLQLTPEEIASITPEKDLKVHIVGVDYSEENIFTIDIKESLGIPSTIYANDLENKLIGATNTMQWKYNEKDNWISYGVQEPDLTGNKTLIVRAGPTDVYVADKTSKTYNFTEDNQPQNKKYISINHLSIYKVSSEQTANKDYAKNVIDGNINTIWHTAYDGSDSAKEIILKLDKTVYLSALQYVPRQTGTNGRAKSATLYVSTDGENWTKVASTTDWKNDASSKMIELEESINTQYVKFVITENWGDGRIFASASMINLFEDLSKTENKDDTQKPSEDKNQNQENNNQDSNVNNNSKPEEDKDQKNENNDTNQANKENNNNKPSTDNNQKPSSDNNKRTDDDTQKSTQNDNQNNETKTEQDNNQKSNENNTQKIGTKKSDKDNTLAKGILPNTGIDYKTITIISAITILVIFILIKITLRDKKRTCRIGRISQKSKNRRMKNRKK